MIKFLLIILLSFASCFARNDEKTDRSFSGTIVKIIDGDTYDLLLEDKKTIRIRMEGIDAPEKKMPFYQVAKDRLGAICFGQEIKVVQSSKDRNGRIIAKTFLPNGSEVGLLMVEAGLAWHFKKYSTDKILAQAEIFARQKRQGLWVENHPMAPWEYRQRKKR